MVDCKQTDLKRMYEESQKSLQMLKRLSAAGLSVYLSVCMRVCALAEKLLSVQS